MKKVNDKGVLVLSVKDIQCLKQETIVGSACYKLNTNVKTVVLLWSMLN